MTSSGNSTGGRQESSKWWAGGPGNTLLVDGTISIPTYMVIQYVVVVILFPTEYKQCITAYMNNNIKNKTT